MKYIALAHTIKQTNYRKIQFGFFREKVLITYPLRKSGYGISPGISQNRKQDGADNAYLQKVGR